MSTFHAQFTFEELSLVRSRDGFASGLIDGYAEIECGRDGTWRIGAIKVQVEKDRDAKFLAPEEMADGGLIKLIVKDRLKAEPWKSRIQEQVDRGLKAAQSEEREFEPEGSP